MSRPKIKIPREDLVQFCKKHQINRLALFGSVLRDDFHEDSDVDVLVSFEPGAKIGFMALGRIKRELSAMLGRDVDVVSQDGLKPLIREAVLACAEELYAA